jgi:hypothetical protein
MQLLNANKIFLKRTRMLNFTSGNPACLISASKAIYSLYFFGHHSIYLLKSGKERR